MDKDKKNEFIYSRLLNKNGCFGLKTNVLERKIKYFLL
jgi:hypothetical protein